MSSTSIRTRPKPDCHVCGTAGEPLHAGLVDRLFGAPGTWAMRRCPDPACGLAWLDPAPLDEDLPRAYEAYYTHGRASPIGPPDPDGPWRPWYRGVVRAWLTRRYGYPAGVPSPLQRAAARLLDLHPIRREDAALGVMYLPWVRGGVLLDVGAGDGGFLRWMAGLGWRVRGVDPDPRAVAAARARGLDVRRGTVEEQGFPDGGFDAVTLRHVLEHVADPRSLLEECRRVLAPGGRLVVVTPNAGSRGHRTFGPDWRGLEPPRHLHLFTRPSLSALARKSGFGTVRARATVRDADGSFARSRLLHGGHPDPEGAEPPLRLRVRARAYQWHTWWRRSSRPDDGEELVLEASP